MFTTKIAKVRASGAAGVVGLALVAAGCGSSSATTTTASSTSSPQPAASSTSSSASGAVATEASISTAHGSAGTYLTDAKGRAVYLWVADGKDMSNCSGACASVWPPVTSKGAPAAGHGVTAADLGTIKRSDGSTQITYEGHPLYYYAADTGPGTTKGQGSDSFGAKWWLVSPAGAAISSGGSGTAAAVSSMSTSSGASGY